MSTEVRPPSSSNLSVHVPITILAIAISLFLFGERKARTDVISVANQDLQSIAAANTQLDELDSKYKAELADPERIETADAYVQVSQQIESMIRDLQGLAKENDPEAKQLVDLIASELGVSLRPPAPGAAAATPAPAGTTPPPK